MKPETLKTRIFLDGGDPEETWQIINLLGFLDGQTTNPTLISRNPKAKYHIDHDLTIKCMEKFSADWDMLIK